MNTSMHIRCQCGHRIVARDVLTTGYILHTGSHSFVFVKFRCSRCKKLGQEVVNRDRWDWSMLQEDPGEMTPDEKRYFDRLGPIEVDEALQFHCELERTGELPEATAE